MPGAYFEETRPHHKQFVVQKSHLFSFSRVFKEGFPVKVYLLYAYNFVLIAETEEQRRKWKNDMEIRGSN